MRTTVTISIDHETLADLDAFGQRRDLKRGRAIRELLNLAAGGAPRETSTTRVVSPVVLGSESEKQRRLAAAMNLHPSMRRVAENLDALARDEVLLGPGERRVDPFEGE